MTQAQENHALTTYYIQKYEALYGKKPTVNRNKASYGWKTMRMDMSLDEIRSLIDFFFTIRDNYDHDLNQFHWNYDEVIESKKVVEKDRQHRDLLSTQSVARNKEFEERLARIKNDQRGTES